MQLYNRYLCIERNCLVENSGGNTYQLINVCRRSNFSVSCTTGLDQQLGRIVETFYNSEQSFYCTMGAKRCWKSIVSEEQSGSLTSYSFLIPLRHDGLRIIQGMVLRTVELLSLNLLVVPIAGSLNPSNLTLEF